MPLPRPALPTPAAGSRIAASAALVSALLASALLVSALAAGTGGGAVAASDPTAHCAADADPESAPDAHLYCVDLLPVPELPRARGVVALRPAPSSFGVAVTRDGVHVYDLVFSLSGLPAPASLGPYTTYVAWATTPQLSPMVRLGEVGNGRSVGGRVALNTFVILVSAERSARVPTRQGPLVLRGLSPSSLMLPHGPGTLPPGRPTAEHAHRHDGWVMPPMHPAVPTMAAGLEALAPAATPMLPRAPEPAALPAARSRAVVDLADGDTLRLEAGLVRRSLGGRELVMYAFNGQHPGPLVRVPQGATIVVDLVNRLDQPTAVHWHGVRLENRSDGVPGLTQPPIPPGDTFRYRVRFPDAGIYWYHPHHREDAQQDLGLAGNLLVRPSRPDHYGPANREEVLLLDDLLVGDDGLVPYGRETTTHALMGRVGNLLLVNGEPSYSLRVRRGEVVRFHLTNAANARVFNLSFGGARMKVVGTDVGRFAREAWVESVVLAPAERYVVDVRFDRPGRHPIENRVQAIHRQAGAFFTDVDTLGAVEVSPEPAVPDHGAAFARLRQDPALAAEAARLRARHGGAPARELTLTLRPGDLPFPLVQALRVDTGYVHPVEWSATMPMMDWLSTGRQVEWVLRDRASGRENMAIAWRFRRGELLRLRLVNDRHTLHPMAHPIHVHGQRFLVLAVNGVPNDNPAWKDTVLVPVGATVDLLVELANPGRWMLHCHIAEHLTAGMHLTFEVT